MLVHVEVTGRLLKALKTFLWDFFRHHLKKRYEGTSFMLKYEITWA